MQALRAFRFVVPMSPPVPAARGGHARPALQTRLRTPMRRLSLFAAAAALLAVATTTSSDHTATDSTGSFTLSVPAGTTMVTFTGRGFQRVAQLLAATRN